MRPSLKLVAHHVSISIDDIDLDSRFACLLQTHAASFAEQRVGEIREKGIVLEAFGTHGVSLSPKTDCDAVSQWDKK